MNINDRMVTLAEENVRRECESSVARIRADLAAEGEDICVDCDCPIEPARKAALPSAARCLACQEQHERNEERAARGL